MDVPEEKNGEVEKNLRLIIKSSILVFIGVFLSKVLLYAYRALIARTYGPETYGVFSLALMVFTLFLVISGFGLSEGLLRYIAMYRGRKEERKIRYIFNYSSVFILISSLIFGVLLYLLAEPISIHAFQDLELINFLKIASIIVPFYALSNLYLGLIRAYEMVGWYSFLINIVQNVVKLAALILLITIGIRENAIMISYFLGIAIMFFISYLLCKHKLAEIFAKSGIGNVEKKEIRSELFKYSIPLMFSSVFSTFFYWIDSFVIGFLKGTYDVGIYNAAVPIAILLAFIPDAFIQLFYPLITKEYSKRNMVVVRETSKQVAKWILLLTLPLFILIFLFPGAIINMLFGEEFITASLSLKILSLGAFLSIFTGYLSTLLAMAGRSRTILINLIIGTAVNLALDFILIPRYGLEGAATATSIVWVMITILLFIEVKKEGFVPLRRKMIRVFIAALIPISAMLGLRRLFPINILTLILILAIFFTLYIFFLIIFRCFDRNDIEIARSFKRKLFFWSKTDI